MAGPEMVLPFLFSNYQFLLICLTVSSRKDLSIAPCFIGGFLFHMRGISDDDFCYQSSVVNDS